MADPDDGWLDPAPSPPTVSDTAADAPNVAPTPQEQSSLALLAKDLMPPAQPQVTVPEIKAVPDRKVPPPGFKLAARNWLRRYASKVRDRVRTHKMIAIAAGGTLVVVVVIAIVLARGGESAVNRGAELAKQGQELLNANDAKHAAELIESELVGPAQPEDGPAYLVLGHARFAMKRYLEALTAYERARTLSPKLAGDPVLRANATKVLESKDAVAAVVALELLASRVTPPAHDVVVQYASTGKLADARRRAFAIAEREGIADKISRVESWSLDLQAAATCEDRRALIAKLASTGDRRAIPRAQAREALQVRREGRGRRDHRARVQRQVMMAREADGPDRWHSSPAAVVTGAQG
jgi:hypothetical protein